MIIAIDGPAASGKGTLARRLAAHYGLPHLDTGLLYRAVAASLIAADRDLHDVGAAIAAARGLGLSEFDEDSLRGREMGEAASIVAAMPEVRAALIEAQRNFARRPGGAVLDGRDIGTVICPERRGQDLRHRQPGDAGATARARTRRARRKGRLRGDPGRDRQARRARFRPRRRAAAEPRPTPFASTRPR